MNTQSVVIKEQVKEVKKFFDEDGFTRSLIISIRYDDRCNNGHNTFSLTGTVYKGKTSNKSIVMGCIHDIIAEHAPELKHLIKWHLCSSDEPLYYVSNTRYWVEQGNLNNARDTAIWYDASDSDLSLDGLEERLMQRLPNLMQEFRTTIESLGFTF